MIGIYRDSLGLQSENRKKWLQLNFKINSNSG